ncbi:MAG: hypothetical protein ACI4AM_08205 [Muribaculaceae bacterium]
MAESKPYIATDTTEPSDSVGVGDALAQDEQEPTVPAHGAAGVAVGAYIGAIARRVLWRYAWWLALPAGLACGGLYDWRCAVIALMLLLLVFPMVVTIAVFNHGMHPAVVHRTRAETVELTDTELVVRDADGAVILTIAHSAIRRITAANGRTTITFGPNPADILILQSSALSADFPPLPLA